MMYNEMKERVLTRERMWLRASYARSDEFSDVTIGREITRRKMQPKLCKYDANPGAPWR